ncbi:MAG: hydroxymethylglutaryl-CoA reductase, degradative [Candidatus Diapherotrites archaeon]|nr:hydroxymethylglutaryl-CoA reductase, degradative [Candidatus Diapherotrites archaeon]
MNSNISGFYKLTAEQRLQRIQQETRISDEEANAIHDPALPINLAEKMIENAVGTMDLPLGVATNFRVNDKDYFVPMAIEEPSVVAAASNAAKTAREAGGFHATTTDPVMIGQIQLVKVKDAPQAKTRILAEKQRILDAANACDPVLVRFGGGAKDINVRVLDSAAGPLVVVHILVDCRDAMGANAVNTMAERLAPMLETITGGTARLRIISNLAVHRLARAEAVFPKSALGEEAISAILEAYALACADEYRCATHNKGVMNGVSAVVLATGNDTRAVEAGAHAYAAMNGYHPLTHYEKNTDGDLVGSIELPMAVGLVGGATKTHPVARANVKMLGVKSAQELAQVIASVGLAQNFAALRALATVGIQAGHMKLHARNIAVTAGASGSLADAVAERMISENAVRVDRAEEILKELRE